ncbi:MULTISPECIES: hypothetical protein [Acetobacter]|uniref:hypothetical protein n=1 Tax=Acetobacter TaxID=434 RepID=UPI00142D6B66|nr:MULTISPECIES: hypothetical protein [Acetobacter]
MSGFLPGAWQEEMQRHAAILRVRKNAMGDSAACPMEAAMVRSLSQAWVFFECYCLLIGHRLMCDRYETTYFLVSFL